MSSSALAAIGVNPAALPSPAASLASQTSPNPACSTGRKYQGDLYAQLKHLQHQLEFVQIQEDYIKDEHKNLKRELIHAKEEIKRIRSVPLVIGQFSEMVDRNTGIVGSTSNQTSYVRILSTIDREQLKPNSSVALHKQSSAVVDILPPEADSAITMVGSHHC